MTFEESIPIAKKLAERQLEKGFDVEAFLILCEIDKLDIVPESNIDEGIKYLLDLFVTYFNNRSVNTLRPLVTTLHQIISELYNTCNSESERSLLKQFISDLHSIGA